MMEDELTIERDGIEYSANYIVVGDTLTVYLPNGEQRSTTLSGGINPESAALPHLRSYINSVTQSKK